MKKNVISIIVWSFVAAMGFGQMASATGYCLRVYCAKDVKTKVKNKEGHGRFFPAAFNKKYNEYAIAWTSWKKIKEKCGFDEKTISLPGTDASKFEKVASWVSVTWEEDDKVDDGVGGWEAYRALKAKCRNMEQKQ